jgi:uncharacterized protein YaiL (DUF2058 family)
MKYAVIAALLATTTSAASGCKPGIVAKVFEKKGCKEGGNESTKYTSEEEIAKSGECQASEPKKDKKTGKVPDVEALKASKAALVKEEKKLKDANTTLNTKDEKVLMRSEEGGTG